MDRLSDLDYQMVSHMAVADSPATVTAMQEQVMIELKVRRIPFDFEGVDFIWNKNNPEFAITMNKLSFFAIAFEKYICQAMRDA